MKIRDIFEFLKPEKQEELEKIYGPTISSWDDVGCWDDVVMKEQKALVSELEEENIGKEKCPYLGKLDNYFYFCKKRAIGLENMGMNLTSKPEITSAQYNSHIDYSSLQLWCMKDEERYSKCMNFKNQDIKYLILKNR